MPSCSTFRVLAALCVIGVLAACQPGEAASPAASSTGAIEVGAGPDAESRLLGAIMARLLDDAGIPVAVVEFDDPSDAQQALELQAIDVRPGYTGETWLAGMNSPDPPGDVLESYTRVRDFDRRDDIMWLRPRFADEPGLDSPPANSTFAFVVQGPPSLDADLRTMSQLASRLAEREDARVCVDEEFGSRPDGLQAVLDAYSVRTGGDFLAADPEEAVLGVRAGDCIAGLTTTTDGDVWRHGLIPLVDDLEVFPAFVPVPQVHARTADDDPEIVRTLGPLASELTTGLLGRWNGRVAAGESREAVAADAAAELRERAGRTPEPTETDG